MKKTKNYYWQVSTMGGVAVLVFAFIIMLAIQKTDARPVSVKTLTEQEQIDTYALENQEALAAAYKAGYMSALEEITTLVCELSGYPHCTAPHRKPK